MILVGDCLDALRAMPSESVDAVVTDPPYGLGKPPPAADVLRAWLDGATYRATGGGFMGASWDAFVPGPEVWREVARVLKPGGHAVIFAGSRTLDWMGISVRLGGLEIRDTLGWVYWSGFPKSLDVSKAIDQIDRAEAVETRARAFTAWMRSTGITAQQINDATKTFMASHYLTDKSQPAVATADLFDLLRPLLPAVPDEIEELVRLRTVESENMRRRAVVGVHKGTSPGCSMRTGMLGGDEDEIGVITAPYTDAARQWFGWGTALKPAIEPAILARKPLAGTVAANVLRHGTGALHIDGCRLVPGDLAWPGPGEAEWSAVFSGVKGAGGVYGNSKPYHSAPSSLGRWPANLYACAKASRAERERGCDGLPARSGADAVHREEGSAGMQSPRAGAGRRREEVRNHHPTVKPIRLMRWLCRLVTPPGGLVVDPFAGSGSTGVAAVLEGFAFTGCELDEGHAAIARARIGHAETSPGEWGDTTPGGKRKKAAKVAKVRKVKVKAVSHPTLFGW